MSKLKDDLTQILQEKQEKIIPENIKKDVQIFDVVGTLESGTSGVKLFETQEEMQADESAKEGDLAVVYRSEVQNMTAETETQYISFPETVTLPGVFESSVYITLRAVDSSAMFDGNIQLSKTSFRFDGFSDNGMIRVEYTSTDGITYTRNTFEGDSGDLTNPVDLGTIIQVYMPEEWNDTFGYFMQVGGNVFDGLYEYTKDKQISYITSNKGTKIYIPEFREIYEDGGSDNLHDGLTSENSLLKVETVDEHNRVLTGKFLYNLNNNAYINEQKDLIAFKSSYGRYYATDISVNWEESKVYYTNRESISLPDDTVALGINLENDTILNRFDIYTSVDKTDVYQEGQEFDYDLNYQMAQNQYTLISSNQLLPNISAYGKNRNVTGDESIYDNLDLTLTTKYLLPSVPTDTNLVEDYKITFFDNDFVPTVTNKIQQLIRDITTNTFAQYYSDNNTEYASEPYAHTLSHNNKIYIIAHDQYAGPNLWYYRIDANTGQVEQFKKNVFDNKELDIVGDAPNKIRQTISVNDNTGDIYFLVYENSSQMKLCKADTSGVITYIYSFSVSKIYNADFLGYNEYNNCLYYIFTTDNQITKINKVSMEGQSTNIYSINDTSRLQYITSSTKSFMTVVLPSINKILVINKQTEEIKEISVTEDVYENLAAYEINDDTINISVGTKDSSYTPLKCYTIKVSTATITPIEAKHQIVPSNSILWSDDQYLYTDGCVGDKDTGYIINYFDSIYKYDNFIVMAKNKNYNILRITCTSTAMNIEKYYPVKMQDIILGEQGILVKWINADTLVNISDVDLLKLSGEEQSPINLEEYNTALTTTEQILREEVTENE